VDGPRADFSGLLRPKVTHLNLSTQTASWVRWTLLVVVASSLVEFPARVGQIQENFHVQAFIAQPAVEAFDVAVLDGSSRTNKI
jgi:hypothetical protein